MTSATSSLILGRSAWMISVMPTNRTMTVEELNHLEVARSQSGAAVSPDQTEQLLDLAIVFRNALREIQVSGSPVARDIATRALGTGKRT